MVWLFLAKSNLALFVACGELSVFALVKSSLDCRLWPWQGYLLESVLLLAGVVNEFIMESILWSSTTVVLCGHPGLFMFLSSLVCFSLYAPNCWFGHFECSCYLSDVVVLFMKPNNGLFHLCGEIICPHGVGSQQQFPNAYGTLRINSRTFTCLIDLEITKK